MDFRVRSGWVRYGGARLRRIRLGTDYWAWLGEVSVAGQGKDRRDPVWHGPARRGWVRQGFYGEAWRVLVW
jgi:hypothetical protein